MFLSGMMDRDLEPPQRKMMTALRCCKYRSALTGGWDFRASHVNYALSMVIDESIQEKPSSQITWGGLRYIK